MSTGVVPVGICKVQLDPVCGNAAAGTPHVSCNITNIDKNIRVEENAAIDIAGGTPGTKCFYLELPNTELPPEVVVDTCTGVDPVLNGITGQLSYTAIDAATGAADPNGIGILVEDCQLAEAACFCECTPGDESCINRVAMTVWRKAYCFGDDAQIHPAGGWWIDHYPALQYQRTAQTSTTSNTADDGGTVPVLRLQQPRLRRPRRDPPGRCGGQRVLVLLLRVHQQRLPPWRVRGLRELRRHQRPRPPTANCRNR